MWRWLLASFLLLGALLLGVWSLAGQASSLQWALAKVVKASEGKLELKGISGNLLGTIHLDAARFADESIQVEASAVDLELALLALLERHLDVTRVRVERLNVTQAPSQTTPTLPEHLQLPLALNLREVKIAHLHYQRAELALDANALLGNLQSTQEGHAWQLQSLELPYGRLIASGSVASTKPFAVRAELEFSDKAAGTSHAILDGDLETLHASLKAEWLGAVADAKLLIHPFAASPLASIEGKFAGFEPQRFDAEAPLASVDARLRASAEGQALTGEFALENKSPGAVSQGQVPVDRISAGFAWQHGTLTLNDLAVLIRGGGALRGSAQVNEKNLQAKLKVSKVNPAQIETALNSDSLNGDLQLETREGQARLATKLTGANGTRYALEAAYLKPLLRISRLQVASKGSVLAAEGELAFTEKRPFTLQVRAQHFDPADFAHWPQAQIEGDALLAGQLQPNWQLRADARIREGSRFQQQTVRAAFNLEASSGRLAKLDGSVNLGSNKADFHGSLGRPEDILHASFEFDALQQVLPAWRGRLSGNAQLSGALKQAALKLEATVKDLRGLENLRIRQGDLSLQAALPADAPLQARLRTSGLEIAGLRATELSVAVNGSQRQHQLQLDLQGEPVALSAHFHGGLRGDIGDPDKIAWHGTIDSLESSAPRVARLLYPTTLHLARQSIQLGDFKIKANPGVFHLNELHLDTQGLSSRGEFSGLPLALLEMPLGRAVTSDALLAGRWAMRADATLNGELKIWRDAGVWPVNASPALLIQPSRLDLTLVARHSALDAKFGLTLNNGSEFDAHFTSPVRRQGMLWLIPSDLTLALDARGRIGDLSWLKRLVGDEVALGGQLDFTMQSSGTLAEPVLQGKMSGQGLSFMHFPSGLAFGDGRLAAHLDGQRLVLDDLNVQSGPGRLVVKGESIFGAQARTRLHLEGDHLALLEHRDWDIDSQLKGDFEIGPNGSSFKGGIRINRGLLLLSGSEAPTLSSDVHIKGREKPRSGETSAAMGIDLAVDLGQDFQVQSTGKSQMLAGRLPFQTSGLRTKAGGKVKIQSSKGEPLRANGVINLNDGSYYLLGQRLDIERGNLLFNGPLLNPVLDISAVRESPEMKAGMSITGTAQNPRARLFSEPEVPDQNKLSWLLFGRGGQAVDTGIGGGAGGMASGLTSFGLQLTDRLYVAYEQSSTGTEQFVNFYSRLSKNLTLEARTGSESSLRLFRTFILPDKSSKEALKGARP